MTSWILTSGPRQPEAWSAPTRPRGPRPVWTPGAPWAGRGAVSRRPVARTPGGAWGPSSPARPSLTPGAASGAWGCRPPEARPWCSRAPPLHHRRVSSRAVTPGGQGALLPHRGPIMATMTHGELRPIQRRHPQKVLLVSYHFALCL